MGKPPFQRMSYLPDEEAEVMGTPLRIRFGTAQAYAPLGYFGVVELPL